MYLPIIQVCKTNLLQNIACDCHLVGSMRNDCEQMTGRCMCRPNFVGLKCERCKDGRLIIDGCDSGDNVSVTHTVSETTTTENEWYHCSDLNCRFGAICQYQQVHYSSFYICIAFERKIDFGFLSSAYSSLLSFKYFFSIRSDIKFLSPGFFFSFHFLLFFLSFFFLTKNRVGSGGMRLSNELSSVILSLSNCLRFRRCQLRI